MHLPEFGISVHKGDREEVRPGVGILAAEHDKSVAGFRSKLDDEGEIFVSASQHRKGYVTGAQELGIADRHVWIEKQKKGERKSDPDLRPKSQVSCSNNGGKCNFLSFFPVVW